MAGAGFKTFNTGDVLTASDVNTYLMQQTVMVFDDASARSTALPTPSEGMYSYLKDTNLTYRYDGSAWLSDAGTTSPLTTKGDVWGYSTTDARIPVGANGTVLTADSAEALGVKWAAPATSSFIGCLAHSLTLQSINNATYTAVNLPDADVYDTNSFHDTSTNNSRITIPSGQGGYYLVWGVVGFKDNATNERQVALYKNGSALTAAGGMGAASIWNAGGGNDAAPYFVTILNLAAADYLQMYARQYSGGALNLGYANFGCQKVG